MIKVSFYTQNPGKIYFFQKLDRKTSKTFTHSINIHPLKQQENQKKRKKMENKNKQKI